MSNIDEIKSSISGIPVFSPSYVTGLRSFFCTSKYKIKLEQAPCDHGKLAIHVARHAMLRHYKCKIIDIALSLLALIFLLTQTRGVNIAYRNYFFSPPFSDVLHIACWYIFLFLYFYTFLILMITAVICLSAFIFSWIADFNNKMYRDSLFALMVEGVNHNFNKFGIDRSPVYFLSMILQCSLLLWMIHILFDMKFRILMMGGTIDGLLSGFDFLYFFLVTYTTLGYGDVIPISNGSRLLVMVVNIGTLLSIVYWFTSLSTRLNKVDILNGYKRQIKKAKKEISQFAKDLKFSSELVKTLSNVEDKVYCPNPKCAKGGCFLCNGEEFIPIEIFLAYGIQTNMSPLKRKRLALGMSRLRYLKYRARLARLLKNNKTL